MAKRPRVHFVGIGGIGMCGLAELLPAQGVPVTGSDLSKGPTGERLRDLGLDSLVQIIPAWCPCQFFEHGLVRFRSLSRGFLVPAHESRLDLGAGSIKRRKLLVKGLFGEDVCDGIRRISKLRIRQTILFESWPFDPHRPVSRSELFQRGFMKVLLQLL